MVHESTFAAKTLEHNGSWLCGLDGMPRAELDRLEMENDISI
jgi:hypothetical protein